MNLAAFLFAVHTNASLVGDDADGRGEAMRLFEAGPTNVHLRAWPEASSDGDGDGDDAAVLIALFVGPELARPARDALADAVAARFVSLWGAGLWTQLQTPP